MEDKIITLKLENFRKSVEQAFCCFDSEGKLQVPESKFIETLYRVSWRASEIPTQLKFATEKSAKEIKVLEHKICMVLSDRDWILLDHLAESLPTIQVGLQSEQFANLYVDLSILRGLLNAQDYPEKPQTSVQLASICRFVEISYDEYLIGKIQSATHAFENISGDISDSKTCYAVFRALEIIGEGFKNLSDKKISEIANGIDIQKAFQDLRNQLHHSDLRVGLIIEYNPVILEKFIQEVLPFISSSVSGNHVTRSVRDVLAYVSEFTEILDRDLLISYKQIKPCLQGENKKLLAKYLYRLNLQKDYLTQEKLEEIKGNLNDEQVKYLYASQHTLPLVKSVIHVDLVDYESKIIEWLKASTQEQENGILPYHVIRNIPYKILFDAKKYQEIFDSLLKGKSSNPDTIDEVKKELAGYDWYQKNQSLFGFTETELEEVVGKKASIADFVRERLSEIKRLISNDQNGKIFAKATLIFYNALTKNSGVTEFLIGELFRYVQDPASLLATLSLLDYRFEEIDQVSEFQRIEGEKKQKLYDLLFRASFDITQEFKNDKEREKLEKLFRNKYFEEQKTPTNASLRSQDYSISKLVGLLSLFESYWLVGAKSETTQDFLMACEFLIERIGVQGNHLATSNRFPETDYLALSKYQLLVLSAARKALAHHPLEVNNNKISYLVEKLGAEARLQIKDSIFTIKDLDHPLDGYQPATIELLRAHESQIRHMVLQHGFRDQFSCYASKFKCDVGVQAELNIIVIPLEASRYSDLFSLEARLGKLLKTSVQIFNFGGSLTLDSKKISSGHRDELDSIEEFTAFLSTEQFREIYKLGNWSAVKIGEIVHQKGMSAVPEHDFVKASSVDYVYEQSVFDKEKEALAIFRQKRLDTHERIKAIVEEKAAGYLRNLIDGIGKLRSSVAAGKFELLKEFLVNDKELDQVIDSLFYSKRSGLLKSGFTDGIIKFRNELKSKVANNQQLDFISNNPALSDLFQRWKEKFDKLPEKLKQNVPKLQLFFFEIKNPEIIKKIFSEQYDLGEVKHLIIDDLEASYIQDNGNKSIEIIQSPVTFGSGIDLNISQIRFSGGIGMVQFATPQSLNGVTINMTPKSYMKVDFASEVEFKYYRECQEYRTKYAYLDSIIEAAIESGFVTGHLLPTIRYTVPHIENGILGWASELKHLNQLFHQVASNCFESVRLEPEIFLESQDLYGKYIGASVFGTPPETKCTMKFNQRLSNSEDILEFYGMSQERREKLSAVDQDAITNYCKYRKILDLFKCHLLRFNHHYAEYIKYVELCRAEEDKKIQQKYVAFIDRIVTESVANLIIIKSKFAELFATQYVKERVKLVLQDPFKLKMLKEEVDKIEKVEEGLKHLLQEALYEIYRTMAIELLNNEDIDHALEAGLIDLSLGVNNVTTDRFGICELELSGLVPLFSE